MTSLISYAQNFEDVMLWRALSHVEHGFYIDIGAQDPLIDSVSLAFHQHGWHGIHVEPTPHYAELLRQQRPGDTIIQAVVGNGPGVLRFFEIPDTGISTAVPIIAQQHRESGFDVHEITVTCITLSAIFESCSEPEIHWLKIDVEGFEEQVLSSWGTSALRPWIIVVESVLPLTQIQSHKSWESILIGYGYSPVYFDGLNRYYISDAHPELKKAFMAPPNVFDGFTLNGTASAPFHNLIEARYQQKISENLAQNEQQKRSLTSKIESLTQDLASLDKTHAEREQALVRQLQTGQQELQRLEQERVQRENEHAEQTFQTRQELENLLRTLAQRGHEVAAQLLTIQQQAHQEKTEQARVHKEQAQALQRQHAEREQALAQQLKVGQQELRRLEQEQAGREKKHIDQINRNQKELEGVLRASAQREQDVAAQLLAIQQQAEQEKAELARGHNEQAQALQRQHAEREQTFTQQLQAGQQELRNMEQERMKREQLLSEQTSQARQDLENLLHTLARREQDVAAQLLAIQQQAEQEKAELARGHNEQAQALQRQHAEREQALGQQLQTSQQELHRLEQELVRHEKEHTEQTNQLQQELKSLLRAMAQREQEAAEQLLAIQQQAEQEKAELTHGHNDQARALQRQHAEREQALDQQLQTDQQERRDLKLELARREQKHTEQTNQLQQELQSLLRAMAQREQEAAAQLLVIQRQVEQEKAELTRSHNDQARVLQRQHVEREQALDRQLHTARQERRDLERELARREKEHAGQISQNQQELEGLLRASAQREQDIATQLLTIQQQAKQERDELARGHIDQARALQCRHAEREQDLGRQLQTALQKLQRLEQELVQREQEHTGQISQTQQELERILRTSAQREQEIAAQLLEIQQQAEQEKAELARGHNDQTRTLERRHAERDLSLTQQLQAKQKELQDHAKNEQEIGKKIAALQSETQSQTQKYNTELSARLDEHIHLIEACAALEIQLKTDILSEQQASLRLRQTLAEVQQSLAITHASLTWRLTSPLRALASLITQKKNTSPLSLGETKPSPLITPPVSESQPTGDQPVSIETITLHSAQMTTPSSSTIASTLDELLAYHDQQFVHCAYQTLLGRSPDPEGLGYYLSRLRTGFSKMRIVAQLRLSKEGKAHAKERKARATTLPGLNQAMKRYQRRQYFLIGWLFRWLNDGESDRPTERKLRAIENQIFLLSDESNRRFNQLETALTGLHHIVVQRTQSTIMAMGGTPSIIPDTSGISPLQPSEPDGLKQISPRARDIYLQLKTAASIHAGRKALCVL